MARSCRLLQMQVGLPAPWPIRDGGRFSNAMCLLVAALAPIGVGLLLIGSAGGVPKPPPKFWSATRCERTVLHVSGGVPPTRGFPLPDSNGHRFHVSQAICVGSGGPHACRWTAGHRSRIYSEFRVFTRSPLNGGIARSFTLATRPASVFCLSNLTAATSTSGGRQTSMYRAPDWSLHTQPRHGSAVTSPRSLLA